MEEKPEVLEENRGESTNEARSQNATETATRREKKADDFWKSGEKISIRS